MFEGKDLITKLSEFCRLAGRHLFPGLTILWRAFITSRKLCPRYGMVRTQDRSESDVVLAPSSVGTAVVA